MDYMSWVQLMQAQMAASAANAQNQQWNGGAPFTPGYLSPPGLQAGLYPRPASPQYPTYPGPFVNPGAPFYPAAATQPGGQFLQPGPYHGFATSPVSLPYGVRPSSAPIMQSTPVSPNISQQKATMRPSAGLRDPIVDTLTNQLRQMEVAGQPSHFPVDGSSYYAEREPSYHSFRLPALPWGNNYFRLAEFSPVPTPQSPISCKLHAVNLQDHPSYIALSYPVSVSKISRRFQKFERIPCNNGYIEVYGGMLDILHSILDRYDPVYLWIDCFCIAPRDPAEKAQQIAMMKHVYRNAKETVIWLEHPHDNVHLVGRALETLKIFYTHFSEVKTRQAFVSKFASIRAIVNELALSQLLQKTYFSRTWMLQEAALSSHAVIYCSTYRITWPEFCQQLACIMRIGYFDSLMLTYPCPLTLDINYVWTMRHKAFITLWSTLEQRRRVQSSATEPLPLKLKQLMRLTRGMDASDLRDRVYALLGLCSDGKEITVNTGKDYTVAMLYHKLALYLTTPRSACCNCDSPVCPDKELSILSEGGLRDWNHPSIKGIQERDKVKLKSLPSWVPVWDHSRGPNFWYEAHTAKHRAGGSTRASIWYDPDAAFPQHLFVTGIITSRIRYVTTASPAFVDDPEFMQLNKISKSVNRTRNSGKWFHEAFMLVQNFVSPYHTRTEDFCLTLCANSSHLESDVLTLTPQRVPITNPRELVRDFNDFMALYEFAESHKFFNDQYTAAQSHILKNHGEGAAKWRQITAGSVTRRTFFLTEEGQMGLGPGLAQIGDEVCVFEGAPTPIVLRAVSKAHGGQFKVVGDAYVHGLMNGEAFQLYPERKDQICLT